MLLVSHSEYPRDKPFLLTMVSYQKKYKSKYKKEKKITQARPVQPKRLVRPGQLAANSERARGLFFSLLYFFFYFFKYETIVSRNGLSLGYSE